MYLLVALKNKFDVLIFLKIKLVVILWIDEVKKKDQV